jgi:hypothetical protein
VAGLDKRLRALERLYHSSSAEGHSSADQSREELSRAAWFGILDAMARIKRAPADEEPWRFNVEKLKDKEPFTIACYIVALADFEHPDEKRAREILEEAVAEQEIEGALPLWKMIDSLVDGLNRMREEREA